MSVMSVSPAGKDNKVKCEIIILNCNWQRKVQRSRFEAKGKVQKWSQVDILSELLLAMILSWPA